MAVYTPTRVWQGQPGTAYTSVQTVQTGRSLIVKEIIACNPTGGSVAFDVSLVASGGSAGVTNNVIANHVVPPYTTVVYTFSQVLAAGGFVAVKASVAATLTLTISGVDVV